LSISSANRRGILAVLGATACFTGNDTVVKLVAKAMPLGEVLFVRGVMVCAMVGALLVALGHLADLRMAASRIVIGRSALEGLAALLFTTALVHMPLAELSTIVLVSPLIITGLSVVLYGEIVGWRRWTAIAVGFMGALLVVKPTPSAFDAWALLGLLCALASACRDLVTRRLPPGIPSLVVSFMSAVAVTLVGAALGLWETWRTPETDEFAMLAAGAVLLAGGNFLIVLAFRDVDVSVIAPFRYGLLIWAGLCGYLVFGEVPDAWSASGAALIVGSGVYALHRESVRAREAAAAAAGAAAAVRAPTLIGPHR
jgi:drug/metabolite transporter (DMT)-like permease